MDKKRPPMQLLLLYSLICSILLGSCSAYSGEGKDFNSEETPGMSSSLYGDARQVRFFRDLGSIDFSGISYTPWDVEAEASLEPQPSRPYTVMIYMNGSDLESESGAGTADIIEMLHSGVDPDSVNVLLFTGGTYRWRNSAVPSDTCMVWRIQKDCIEPVADVGLVNMGDAGTLSSFINFSIRNFPAEKYGLILWDHGGGSIAGYGHDENFNNGTLTLLEMNYAFEQSDINQKKLEFLGFDACLMATVEMAVVAQPYANYLVASEDLEPGDGWDYSFLAVLTGSADLDGAAVGRVITDYYMDFYGQKSMEDLSLSVVDLSRADSVMGAMDRLMGLCSSGLLKDREASFRTFAKKRDKTKTFGNGTPRDNDCDMVDIGDMANKFSDLFPEEAALVHKALKDVVLYNRHNSATDLGGLSSYYIFGGKEDADKSLKTYEGLGMSETYTGYLRSFAGILTGDGLPEHKNRSSGEGGGGGGEGEGGGGGDEYLRTQLTIWEPLEERNGYYMMAGIKDGSETADGETLENSALWPSINGSLVCMYEIDASVKKSIFAIPASLNDRDVDLIVLVCDEYPDGKILGARQEDGYIIQKGLYDIERGDKLSFYYEVMNFGGDGSIDEWIKGEAFTAGDELELEWRRPDTGKTYYSSYLNIDIQENKHFTALMPLKTDRAA